MNADLLVLAAFGLLVAVCLGVAALVALILHWLPENPMGGMFVDPGPVRQRRPRTGGSAGTRRAVGTDWARVLADLPAQRGTRPQAQPASMSPARPVAQAQPAASHWNAAPARPPGRAVPPPQSWRPTAGTAAAPLRPAVVPPRPTRPAPPQPPRPPAPGPSDRPMVGGFPRPVAPPPVRPPVVPPTGR